MKQDSAGTTPDRKYGYNRVILHAFSGHFSRGINSPIGENGSVKSTVLKLLCSWQKCSECFSRNPGLPCSRGS